MSDYPTKCELLAGGRLLVCKAEPEVICLRTEIEQLQAALHELTEACEYVSPFAGAVATKASVKHIRQAGRFVAAVEKARAALAGKEGK